MGYMALFPTDWKVRPSSVSEKNRIVTNILRCAISFRVKLTYIGRCLLPAPRALVRFGLCPNPAALQSRVVKLVVDLSGKKKTLCFLEAGHRDSPKYAFKDSREVLYEDNGHLVPSIIISQLVFNIL